MILNQRSAKHSAVDELRERKELGIALVLLVGYMMLIMLDVRPLSSCAYDEYSAALKSKIGHSVQSHGSSYTSPAEVTRLTY